MVKVYQIKRINCQTDHLIRDGGSMNGQKSVVFSMQQCYFLAQTPNYM